MNNTHTQTPKRSNFYECNDLGLTGEKIVQDIFSATDAMYKCTSQLWRDKDVDFVNIREYADAETMPVDSNLYTLEVKTDDSIYQNICLEIVSNCNKGTPGWSLYTEAKIVAVYRPQLHRVYFLNGELLKEFTKANMNNYKHHTIPTYNTNGQKIYNGITICVPIKRLIQEKVIRSYYDLITKQFYSNKRKKN